MNSALFEFFEIVAEELTVKSSRVITRQDIEGQHDRWGVLDDLQAELKTSNAHETIAAAVDRLTEHFRARGATLPFSYDAKSGRFTSTDKKYLLFIKEVKEIRSIGKRSRQFEIGVLDRLKWRVTGALHRVGFPRDKLKKRDDFNKYLLRLGFNGKVALEKEKDGGLDVLWVLPLGAIPHQPIVSVQCKNGTFTIADADKSVGSSKRSLNQHRGLMSEVHVLCVLFNDYISAESLPAKALNWVPLGLSDLCMLSNPVSSKRI